MSKESRVPRSAPGLDRLPRLPHPSWRRALNGAEPDRRVLTADDFWTRLGL